jgi:hypothetical protein
LVRAPSSSSEARRPSSFVVPLPAGEHVPAAGGVALFEVDGDARCGAAEAEVEDVGGEGGHGGMPE